MGSLTTALPDASTTIKGKVQLDSTTSSTSTTKAGTPSAVKSAYDLANTANTAAAAAQTTANTANTAAATAQAAANGKVSQDSGSGAVGSFNIMKANPGPVAAGATVAGASLYHVYWDFSNSLTSGPAASGTWRNVSGASTGNGGSALFQRIA